MHAHAPQIEKKEVDDHSHENQTVPHCELVAKWMKDENQAKALMHTVDILGTTKKNKYFTINIDPGIKAGMPVTNIKHNFSPSPLNDITSSILPDFVYPSLHKRQFHQDFECFSPIDKATDMGSDSQSLTLIERKELSE